MARVLFYIFQTLVLIVSCWNANKGNTTAIWVATVMNGFYVFFLIAKFLMTPLAYINFPFHFAYCILGIIHLLKLNNATIKEANQ